LKISVIIPSHNRAHTLPRAIDSVLAQSEPPLEILLVDDGSEDSTRELLATDYPQVRYLYQQNRGVSAARNLGICESRGEWVALLDSDDEWLPGKLAAQRRLLGANSDLRICHTEEIWVRNGKRVNAMKKHAKRGGRVYLDCLPLCVISPSSVVIHRDLLDQLGRFDEELPACEDYDLWLRICAQERVGFVKEPQIVKYGGHEDQLSRAHWGMDRFRITALAKQLENPLLSDQERQATLAIFKKKCEILALGAEKREKQGEAAHYRSLALGADPQQ
jgi:glycosyltransferase involved in cell wall biosynthesis